MFLTKNFLELKFIHQADQKYVPACIFSWEQCKRSTRTNLKSLLETEASIKKIQVKEQEFT